MMKHNTKIFAMGRLISLLGTYMYQFAAGLYVLDLTGSGTKFALTLIMGTLPRVILAPFAGVAADRFSRKAIVVISDFLSGAILLLALLGSTHSIMSVNTIYITMIALTACNTFFDVAIEAAKPGLVETEQQLEKLNALSYGIHSFTSIVGPILGGVAYALVSFNLFVFVNGVSFIVSGLSEMLLSFKKENHLTSGERFIDALGGGIKYLKANNFSIVLMSFSLSINFCMAMSLTVPIPYLINNILKLNSSWVGIVNSGFPIGFLLGTLYINARGVERRGIALYKGIWVVWFGMAMIFFISLISSMNSPYFSETICAVIITGLLGIIGASISFIDIPLMSFLQMIIPSEVRGRVFSVMTMASRMAIPLAMIISGRLLNVIHPAYLVFIGTAVYLFVILTITQTIYFREYVETDTITVAYSHMDIS